MIIDSGIVTGSLQVSGSFSVQGNTELNGGLNVIGGITGSISGSSATAISASYALSASFATTATNAPFYVLTASYTTDSASFSTRTTNLESWSSSLDAIYATDAQLNASASALQAGVTASIAAFATTGSNTFTGNNVFTNITASNGKFNSASIEYLSVVYQTSSIVYSSGSNQFGDSPSDTQTLYGTIDIKNGPVLVTGSLNVSNTATATSGTFGHIYSDFIKSPFIYASGSSQLGNAANDYQAIFGTVDIINGPVLVTGSLNVASRITAGELTVLYGITGSINGTASYVEFAQSASLALLAELATTASHAINSNIAITSSYALQAQNAFSASYAGESALAFTASYVQNAQSASYVQVAQTASYVTLAQTASYVLTAQNANSASYVSLAQSASYVFEAQNAFSASIAALAINANTASYVTLAQTASYVLTAQSASHAAYAEIATTAYTASSANDFVARGIVGLGGPANGLYQVYVTTSINDGTLALDSSGDYNAMYFLKGGFKKFEISTTGDGTPITQIVPYTSSGIFRIGNPSNASTDYILLSEPTGGRVILGPGISDTTQALSGSQQTDLVQFTGNTFVSGALTTLRSVSVQGGVTSIGGFTGSLQGTADTAISAPYYVLTASYQADSSSVSTRTTNLESTASTLTNASASFASSINSLQGITGSYATTGSNTFIGNQTIYGNLFMSGSNRLIYNNDNTNAMLFGFFDGSSIYGPYYQIFGGQYATVGQRGSAEFVYDVRNNANANFHIASYNGSAWTQKFIVNDNGAEVTGSLNVTGGITGSLNGTADTAISAPYYVLTASYQTDSASVSTRTTNLESTASTLTSASASFASSINSLQGVTGSYATTGSNTFTGAQYISNTTDATNFTSTPALYTDGGFRATKNAYISGGLYVAGDLTVYGTSSISYVTTSVFVGLEYINLNTDLPALRYAGINVGDSGSSTGVSSSFWYDSQKDNWLYVYAPAGATQQTSSLAINGPITYNNLGNEQGLLGNYIVKSQLITPENNHHITSSQIFDDGTTVAIAGNLQVTGSLRAGNLTGSLAGSNLVAGSVANDRLTNSAITIAGTSTSLGGSISAATILSGTGVFSGSAQIPSTSITNAQLVNSAVTVTAGTGLSGGGSVSLGGSVTLTNAGVTSITGTSNQVIASTSTGGVTLSLPQSIATNSNVQFANIISSNQFVTVSGGTAAVNITGSGTIGGTGFLDFLRVSNNSAGVTNPNKAFRVGNTGTFEVVNSAYTTVLLSLTDAGALTAAADVTAFSDARLKENVNTITNAVDKVTRLRGVTYTRVDLEDKSEKMGVIAQETQEVVPQVVAESEDGTLSVAYGNLSGLFIEAFKEQQAEINDLKATVLELREIINKLK